jgi:hypothetical protein
VIAPARTGRDRSSKIAVTKIDQENMEVFPGARPNKRIFAIVEMKMVAPKIEEIPAK